MEVADGLLNLVCLSEDHSELVQDFALLVEVRGHFEDSDKSTDGVVIRLEFFVEDSDSVPELWVFDVL